MLNIYTANGNKNMAMPPFTNYSVCQYANANATAIIYASFDMPKPPFNMPMPLQLYASFNMPMPPSICLCHHSKIIQCANNHCHCHCQYAYIYTAIVNMPTPLQ